MTRTAPPPCRSCKGSRKVVRILGPSLWNFDFRTCRDCRGLGVADPDDIEPPGEHRWPAPPEEVSRAS